MNIENFNKLYQIFSDKNWHSKKEYNNTVFANFCKLLSNLNQNQQDLIIELTERYEWLSFNEYNATLIKIFESIPEEEILATQKIFLFPIVRIEEEEKTKSGHGILLMLRGIRPFLKRFEHILFEEVERFEMFNSQLTINDNDYIYLLDDFLGSGSTLDSTINELVKYSIPIEKIRVISIATHIQAAEYMNSKAINYYTEIITKKGISEYYLDDSIKSEKINIMNQIEKLLPTKKYNFGFGKSEALVTLYRTPNNTFPIFWLDHIKDEVHYKAPFPRF